MAKNFGSHSSFLVPAPLLSLEGAFNGGNQHGLGTSPPSAEPLAREGEAPEFSEAVGAAERGKSRRRGGRGKRKSQPVSWLAPL